MALKTGERLDYYPTATHGVRALLQLESQITEQPENSAALQGSVNKVL